MSKNPFSPGKLVSSESFVGWASEIGIAFDRIASRSSLAIWGGAGMGKSSFLELLISPQVWQHYGCEHSESIIIYLDCLGIMPFLPATFWREILSLIKDELVDDDLLQTGIDQSLRKAEATKDDLRQFLKQIGKQNKFLLLLLDNYDAAFRPHDQYKESSIEIFLSETRNLAVQSKGCLSMIVTSFRRLNELGPKLSPDKSPWYNHYLFQPLKPFTDSEIDTLLGCMPMTTALREGIREITDGHPALIQHAGYLLYDKLHTGQMPDPEAFTRDFLSATEQFFQQTWEMSNQEEQTLLMLIALSNLKGRLQRKNYDLGDISIVFSQRERELTDLEQRGVIIRTMQQGRPNYAFASSMMEWWVIKEIENSNEEELQQRQKVFLNLMSSKQAEQVKTGIRYLWQHKDEVPSVIEWVSKLVSAIPKGFVSG